MCIIRKFYNYTISKSIKWTYSAIKESKKKGESDYISTISII